MAGMAQSYISRVGTARRARTCFPWIGSRSFRAVAGWRVPSTPAKQQLRPVQSNRTTILASMVRSPLIAARATLALKSGEWFRRVRFVILAPDSHAQPCALSGRDSTHRTVRNCGAVSNDRLSTELEAYRVHLSRRLYRRVHGGVGRVAQVGR